MLRGFFFNVSILESLLQGMLELEIFRALFFRAKCSSTSAFSNRSSLSVSYLVFKSALNVYILGERFPGSAPITREHVYISGATDTFDCAALQRDYFFRVRCRLTPFYHLLVTAVRGELIR